MKFRHLIASVLICWAQTSIADMYVDRSIVIFEAGTQPRQDVKVSNSGDEVMYVKVDVLTVENPGSDDEARVEVSDPKQLKLLATPNRLIIPPGGQRLIRIVNLQPNNDSERVYRINVTPIVAPLEEETSQLRIVVAYQILTIVQPDEPTANLIANRNGKSISFTNTGNTNVLLSEGKQCQPNSVDECQELASRRLYAGNSWQQELPYDGPVSYSVRSFDGIKQEVYP